MSDAAPARRGRPGYDQATVLRRAIELFNRQGYDATSIGDLARDLGITKSAIYHHVPSKEALLTAALDEALDGLSRAIDAAANEAAGTSAYERLRSKFPLGADYAMAYLIAEAYGHHVQWALGVFTDLVALQSRKDTDGSEALERQIDQQAACYAAMWTITAGIKELDKNAAVMAAVEAVEANRGNAIINLPLGKVVPEVLSTASTDARAFWYDKGYAIPAPGSCKLEKIAAEGMV